MLSKTERTPLTRRRTVTWPVACLLLGIALTHSSERSPIERLAVGVFAGIILAILALLPAYFLDRRKGSGRLRVPVGSAGESLLFIGLIALAITMKAAFIGGIPSLIAGAPFFLMFRTPRSSLVGPALDGSRATGPAVWTSTPAKPVNTILKSETGLSERAFRQAAALIMIAAVSLWLAFNMRSGNEPTGLKQTQVDSTHTALNELGGTPEEWEAEAEYLAAQDARAQGFRPYVHVDDCSIVDLPPEEADARPSADLDALPDHCHGKLHYADPR